MNAAELAGLGRLQKEVEPVKGLKVTFHSLSVREERDINLAMAQIPPDPLARMNCIQIETLVRAIEKVGDKTFVDPKELRDYIEGLQRHTLTILWESWQSKVDDLSLKDVEDLKKNSEPPVPA